MPTPTDEPAAPAGDPGEARPEDVAEVVLTEWVRGFVSTTCEWLDESGKAFERHLHKALHPPGYTTAEIVQDVTDVWTRNLGYLASLFTLARGAGPAAEATVDTRIDARLDDGDLA
jgi:hypothetical protein